MNIVFADKETHDRFVTCSWKTAEQRNSLDRCVANIMRWQPYDWNCVISRDFHELSFFFVERCPDGRKRGMCGGIIYHGSYGKPEADGTPTFACRLESDDGYSIHT